MVPTYRASHSHHSNCCVCYRAYSRKLSQCDLPAHRVCSHVRYPLHIVHNRSEAQDSRCLPQNDHIDPCRAPFAIAEVALLHDQIQSGVQFESWIMCWTHISCLDNLKRVRKSYTMDGNSLMILEGVSRVLLKGNLKSEYQLKYLGSTGVLLLTESQYVRTRQVFGFHVVPPIR
jgi:hypothetical protein